MFFCVRAAVFPPSPQNERKPPATVAFWTWSRITTLKTLLESHFGDDVPKCAWRTRFSPNFGEPGCQDADNVLYASAKCFVCVRMFSLRPHVFCVRAAVCPPSPQNERKPPAREALWTWSRITTLKTPARVTFRRRCSEMCVAHRV